MKILLLLAYFLFKASPEPVIIQEAEIPQMELDLKQAQLGIEMRKVALEIDGTGKVSAVSGDDKLDAFDPALAGKMKPLDDWLAKIGQKEKLSVTVRVDGNTIQKTATDVLNVFANQGIKEITFTDLIKK